MSQQVIEYAETMFENNFDASAEAQEYMEKRGFKLDFLKSMGVGFAPGDLTKKLKGKGFKRGEILDSRLIAMDETGSMYDFFRNRIMFPIKILGSTQFMSGRDITDKAHSKYINLPTKNIFWINEELLQYRPEWAVINEGYTDCYTLLQAEFPAMGMSNCNRRSPFLLRKLLSVKTIFIMFDTDANKAGEIGAAKTAYNLVRLGHMGIKICKLPHFGKPKMDVNSLSLLLGEGFKSKIDQLLGEAQRSPSFHQTKLYLEMLKKEESLKQKKEEEGDISFEENWKLITELLSDSAITYDHAKYYQVCCPIHGEEKGSFTVYKDDGQIVCYGCGFRGNGLDLKTALQNKELKGAFDI